MGKKANKNLRKEIFVYRATHFWSQGSGYIRKDRYWYVIDDKVDGASFSNAELHDMKDLAKELYQRLQPGDTVSYKPPVSSETMYGDGFWGRPLVPSNYFEYKPLKRKQIKELQGYLERLLKQKNAQQSYN